MDVNDIEMDVLTTVLPRIAKVFKDGYVEEAHLAVAIGQVAEMMQTYRLCNWFNFKPIECAAIIHALSFNVVYYLPKNPNGIEESLCRIMIQRFHDYSEQVLGRD